MKIRLDQIKENKHSLRSDSGNGSMDELVESVREHGVIVPIKVREIKTDIFEIIYGHRRFEACKRLKLKEVDVIVEGIDDTETLLQSVIENIQREDLSDMEEGEAFLAIKKQTNWPDQKIGEQIGKSQKYVNERLLLIQSGEILSTFTPRGVKGEHTIPVKDAARKATSIRRIEKEAPDLVKSIAKKVVDEGLTSRQTEYLVDEVKKRRFFGGDKAAKELIARPYEKIDRATEDADFNVPKKHVPVEPTPEQKAKSSFLQTKEFETAFIDITVISRAIAFINKNKDMNRSSARAALKTIIASLNTLLKQANSVLGDL